MSLSETFVRARSKYFPDHIIGEILTKRWSDNAVPFAALILVVAVFGSLNPAMFSAYGLFDLAGQVSEYGLMAIALTVVMIAGGIDLSIGSVFALSALTILASLNVYNLPLGVAFALTLGVGAICGAINGILIGFLRLRAFLTTLVTLIMFRSIYEIIMPNFATKIVLGFPDSTIWNEMGLGSLWGLPYAVYLAAIVAIVWHIILSRSRPGWQMAAVGGSRRSAFNAGIKVRRVVFMTYVYSGLLVALAATFYGARLNGIGTDTGVGIEISVLTGVVLGGTTLGGGRGSVAKALMGAVIVLILQNGLLQMGLLGTISAMILGIVLLFGVWLDVRWLKNRHKLLNSSYVSPAYLKLPDAPDPEVGGVYAVNNALASSIPLALGDVEGPEDVAIDKDGNLYSGSRHGEIHRWLAPDYTKHEIFAHIGGGTFGMNFDKDGNLCVCVGGMGLYMVTPEREVVKLTDETNRTPWSIIDDSRLRLADDLDIAPDGRIFFSEATYRYSGHEWQVDMLESRGNGRLICYDPRDKSTKTLLNNRIFPNGIVCLPDGESLLFCETWACSLSRFWYDGPKKGTVEPVIANLPGYPDNINRASDGNIWLCLIGMRAPVLDLAMTRPGFRRRMTRRVAPANWLYPNINMGCLVKITPEGEVLEVFWDKDCVNHPMPTSCKEDRGHLFIGGVSNNRIGKWRIPNADENWSEHSKWEPNT
jgi:ribose transport system permease protein